MFKSIIKGTGSYIPELVIDNQTFSSALFYESNNVPLGKNTEVVISKFSEITGIKSRRYAKHNQVASDLGTLAAESAIADAEIDKETLDYIIVAHNFGDVLPNSNRVDILPTLASRIKMNLQIKNPACVAYDLPFGCPGWVEAVIQANYFIRTGDAKRCLVIGAETLSRVVDPHDRDSMIYSDGAGAVVLEGAGQTERGILAHATETHAIQHAMLLHMGPGYHQENERDENRYIKMQGRKVYEFAVTHVPVAIAKALAKANVALSDVKKILIHQANEKMDEAIIQRVYKNASLPVPENIMPMTIGWLGNSSVATVPTMLDLIKRDKFLPHEINDGDVIVFASVGAGMNINAIVYRW
ncbi:MAG: ketoacyl-ACP synthase III [Cyclobacteriaceae bacterium]|jgi:3-oxoacyl-[acyl-carrier-protein] synthase-3|nr:ketoacyl-ACP synthase III [Cyclobacteriaceae bacterium]